MFLFVLFLVLLDTSIANIYQGYRVLRLFPVTNAQVEWVRDLHNSLDFWSQNDVMVSPEQEILLTKDLINMDIAWETIMHNIQDTILAENFRNRRDLSHDTEADITFNKFNRYDDIVQYLTTLQAKYPERVSVGTMANSSEGRSVPLIKISSGKNTNPPIILIDAGIHAREWIAPAMALYIIHQLVENSSNTDLLTNAEWHIIPTLNPDGYEYSHRPGKRFWRKTRSAHNCSTDAEHNHGVDGNRNFDFHWKEDGSSGDTCSEIFAGPFPFSEPETRGLRDHVLTNAPRIKLYISLHSFGNFFLFPWGYTSELPSNNKELHDLAVAANAAQVAAGGYNCTIGTSYNVLSPGAGGSDDWVKGVGGVELSYTIELPGGFQDSILGFEIPTTEILRIVSRFFPAVRVMGEYVNKLK